MADHTYTGEQHPTAECFLCHRPRRDHRVRIPAAELKAKWMSDQATGLIHDHQTDEVVVSMADGTEYACTFEQHQEELNRV